MWQSPAPAGSNHLKPQLMCKASVSAAAMKIVSFAVRRPSITQRSAHLSANSWQRNCKATPHVFMRLGINPLTLSPPCAQRNTKPLVLYLRSPATERHRVCLRRVPVHLHRAACTCLLSYSHWSSPLPPVQWNTHKHITYTLKRGRAASLRGVRTPTARAAAPLPVYGGLEALNRSSKLLSK